MHIRDETEHLFPLLSQRCTEEDAIDTAINRIRADQCEAMILLPDLRALLVDCLDTGAAPNADQRALLTRFAAHVRRHLVAENAILLPIARARLSRSDLRSLSRHMRTRRGFPTRREHPTLNDRLRRNRDSSFRRRHRSRPVSPALPHFRYLNPSGSAVRTAGSGECRRWPRSGRSPCPSHHGERDPLPGHKSSFNDIWRMRWDSNPRNLSVRWFSRPVPSTARPLIRRRNSGPVPSSTRPRVR